FLNFLNPNSRFRTLARLINKDALKHTASVLALFVALFGADKILAQDLNTSLGQNLLVVDKEHIKELKSLIVQKSADGRMVPFDT
ncbi:hypothetical protein, partial [Campylobacter coli]|uniref:hypothetical protein n=1 Tax=Campylobacter coli TaxID=195 RepID=UPI0015CF816C